MRRFFLLLTIFSLALLRLEAQTSFTVEAPRVAALGEPFRVEFVLSGEPDDFVAPDFGSFEVIAGPSISQGSSVSIINGKTTRSFSVTYTYVLLANQTGNQTIGSAKAEVDGKNYSTKPYPVEIVNERKSPQSNQSGGSSQRVATLAKDDILMRFVVNKNNVYRGEAIVADLKLYYRAQVVGFEGFKPPAFNGFWTQEVQLEPGQPSTRETFDGKIYDVATIKRYILFPQKSGTLEIERMDATPIARIAMGSSSGGGSLFDSMFGGGQSVQDIPRNVFSSPVKITVKELPSAPASFYGAVGDFSMTAHMSQDEISANSAANITLRIEGTGNLPLVTTPKIGLPTSFEQYDTKSSDDMAVWGGSMRGHKQYEYPFIARAEGNFDIAPVQFTYFDPAKGEYKTLSSQPFKLNVGADGSSASTSDLAVVSGVTKQELKILDSDIKHIFTEIGDVESSNSFVISSPIYWLLYALFIAVFVGALVYLNRRIKQMRDMVAMRNKRANKVALKRLKTARGFMLEGRTNAFYSEMIKVIMGYIGDKLNIGVSALTKDRIQSELTSAGVASEDVDQLLKILSDCEYSQYAPTEGVQMATIYQSMLDLIGRIENSLKK